MRSYIISSLLNKRLKVFLEDDAEIYYNCILDGAVNITYYRGYNISRCFSLSFNLLAYEGVGWRERLYKKKLRNSCSFDFVGTHPSVCRFFIRLDRSDDTLIKKDPHSPFIAFEYKQHPYRELWLKKDIHLKDGKKHSVFFNFEPENIEKSEHEYLDTLTIMYPLVILDGDVNVFIDYNTIQCESNIKKEEALEIFFAYRPCYI